MYICIYLYIHIQGFGGGASAPNQPLEAGPPLHFNYRRPRCKWGCSVPGDGTYESYVGVIMVYSPFLAHRAPPIGLRQ